MQMFLVAMLLGAATPAATTPAASPPPAEADGSKQICRKQEVIGSLIKSRRVCLTAREWERSSEAARNTAQEMSQPGASSGN